MKKYFKHIVLFFVVPFIINGCYTILWTPEDDFPSESSYEYNSYYDNGYDYYYDYPWWLSITPPVKYRTNDNTVYEREKGTSTLRNNGNGRNSSGSRIEILDTPPPTKSYPSQDNNSDNFSERKDHSRTETVTSSSNNNPRQSSGSNGSSLRNNDGNRKNSR